jgi:hypothetical protein
MSLYNGKKYIIVVLAFLLFIGSTQTLKADWTCENAFDLCITTRWTVNNPGEAIRCIMGYSFCKNYVEPFI